MKTIDEYHDEWLSKLKQDFDQFIKYRPQNKNIGLKVKYVSAIPEWEVTECDFNKDIKASDYFHITSLKVRIKHLDHLLGLYVKTMGQDTVLRVEETKRPNMRAADFITDIFNPMEKFQTELLELGRKITELYDIITKSLAAQSSTENGEGVV